MAHKYQNLDVALARIKFLGISRDLKLRVERTLKQLKTDKRLRDTCGYNTKVVTVSTLFMWNHTPLVTAKEWLKISVALSDKALTYEQV